MRTAVRNGVNEYGIVAAAMLQSTKTKRFHPIIYRDAPFPCSDVEHEVRRLKSKGHHTQGFTTLEEAISYMENDEKLAGTVFQFNPIMLWNEEHVPADVLLFNNSSKRLAL